MNNLIAFDSFLFKSSEDSSLLISHHRQIVSSLPIVCSTKPSRCGPSCAWIVIFIISMKNQEMLIPGIFSGHFVIFPNYMIPILWRTLPVDPELSCSKYVGGGCSEYVSVVPVLAWLPDSSDFPMPIPIKTPSTRPITKVQNFSLEQSLSPEIS